MGSALSVAFTTIQRVVAFGRIDFLADLCQFGFNARLGDGIAGLPDAANGDVLARLA